MDAIEVIDYKGYQIKVMIDNDPLNPVDPITGWDMFGTMYFVHSRYDLGHAHDNSHQDFLNSESYYDENYGCYVSYEDTPEDFLKWLGKNQGKVLALPVYAYEHGGITISVRRGGQFSDPWDSGKLGYIYVTYEKIRNNYFCKRVTKAILEKAEKVLRQEIESYDMYLTGEIYGVSAENDDDEVDSFWGFYGEDGKQEGIKDMKDIIDDRVTEQDEQAWLSVNSMPEGVL